MPGRADQKERERKRSAKSCQTILGFIKKAKPSDKTEENKEENIENNETVAGCSFLADQTETTENDKTAGALKPTTQNTNSNKVDADFANNSTKIEITSPDYIDITNDTNVKSINDNEKRKILESSWTGQEFRFQPKKSSGKERKCQSKWFKETNWLRYSQSTDTVYCVYCVLFGYGSKGTAMRTGDWSNIIKLIKKHQDSEYHLSCQARAESFLQVQQQKLPNIRAQLNEQARLRMNTNFQVIESIAEILLMMGKQNIAILGHTPDQSNFNAIIEHTAKYNTVLQDHLLNAKGNAKYTSPEIQNELLDLMADEVLQAIIRDCNEARCFTFIADESTDVGVKEQISTCVRFIHKDQQGKHNIREEFLQFVHADGGTTAEALSNKFVQTLEILEIDIQRMRAQGYDGAAVMSGHVSGVQRRIREIVPSAIYFHCRPHLLNLCIVHSSKVKIVRNVMDTMTEVAIAFRYSSKRLLSFQEHLEENAEVQEQMGRRITLKTLCETRWASRADSLNVFVSSYPVIVEALEDLSQGGDSKARGLAASISKWDFVLATVTLNHLFEYTHGLSVFLQKTKLDLVEASKEASICLSVFEAERSDEGVWDALYEKAENMASDFDITPSKPRTVGRQKHCDNVASSVKDYWKRGMYLPFLDHLISEIRENLVSPLPGFHAQYLVPSKLQELDGNAVDHIYNHFGHDFTINKEQFKHEVNRWKARWQHTEDKPNSLIKTLDRTNENLYPSIYISICTLATYPVSVCTAERSFSALKRIKTPLRNTMTNQRLSSLAILHIHKDHNVDIRTVVQKFANAKPRRMELM